MHVRPVILQCLSAFSVHSQCMFWVEPIDVFESYRHDYCKVSSGPLWLIFLREWLTALQLTDLDSRPQPPAWLRLRFGHAKCP